MLEKNLLTMMTIRTYIQINHVLDQEMQEEGMGGNYEAAEGPGTFPAPGS